MKVKMEKDYKTWYSVAEAEAAKMVIKAEKEDDDNKASDWAEYAAKEWMGDQAWALVQILSAEATTRLNMRAWDAWGEGSMDVDVWITFTAQTNNGFLQGGAYLSDIWQSGSTPYKHHMYVREARWTDRITCR